MIEAKADLWYGASSTGKTGGIGELAERLYEQTGKLTELVTSDGGGLQTIRPHIEAGIVKVWVIGQDEPHPVEAWDFAAQGYWPDHATRKYTKSGLEKVALRAFEGLTSCGDIIMNKLRRDKVRLSQDPSYVFKDGGTDFAGGNMTYFGFAQDRLYDLVMKSHTLPVDLVVWTALETKGEEMGLPVYGPAIAGKKSISKAPAWFRRTLHMELAAVEGKKDANNQVALLMKRIIYLKPHADPLSKIVFPANPRVPLSAMAALPDFIEPASMRVAYDLLDKLNQETTQRLAKLVAARSSSTHPTVATATQ